MNLYSSLITAASVYILLLASVARVDSFHIGASSIKLRFESLQYRSHRSEDLQLCTFSKDDTDVGIQTELNSKEVALMEIRVGKIVSIDKHPEAESLYVEQVDCGEEDGPRTIVSGLVKYCSDKELLDRNVVVLANLKPRPLKGIVSAGMLLCASNEDHTQVAPLEPPAGVEIGELITFPGYASVPVDAGNKASKVFSKIANDFFVDNDMKATYKGSPFMTSKGVILATLKGKIS